MRVFGLGLLYGAVLGAMLAALFGVVVALAGPSLGMLPHNMADLSPAQTVLNIALTGLVAGLVGGGLLGLLIGTFAPGKVSLGQWIGAVAALLPLLWLPFFGLRAILRRGTVGVEDVVEIVVLVALPLLIAGAAGVVMGGRLARAAQ